MFKLILIPQLKLYLQGLQEWIQGGGHSHPPDRVKLFDYLMET